MVTQKRPHGLAADVGRLLAAVLDAIPDGVCLETASGAPVLSNAVMHRLMSSPHRAELAAAMTALRRELDASRRKPNGVGRVIRSGSTDYVVRAFHVRRDAIRGQELVLFFARSMSRQVSDLSALKARFDLTEREVEVAAQLSYGLRNSEVAARLGITPFTARRHTERVLAKLGLGSRAQAAAFVSRFVGGASEAIE